MVGFLNNIVICPRISACMWSFTNVHIRRFWDGLEIVSHIDYMYARPFCTDNSIINITLSQGYLLTTAYNYVTTL